MLKQSLAFGFLIAIPGCTINITTEGPHEGSDHHEWHEEKEEWHGTEEEWLEEKKGWHEDTRKDRRTQSHAIRPMRTKPDTKRESQSRPNPKSRESFQPGKIRACISSNQSFSQSFIQEHAKVRRGKYQGEKYDRGQYSHAEHRAWPSPVLCSHP